MWSLAAIASPLIALLLIPSDLFALNPGMQETKRQILDYARTITGQGDPDFLKQKTLAPLVKRLLEQNPQPGVRERLPLLQGAWKQIWGRYDYRNDDRGVDPGLGLEEIYQVLLEGGVYYNASYLYKPGYPDSERVGLLRGEYSIDDKDPNSLRVRFTRYPGLQKRIEGKALWQLPLLVETGHLETISIVPTWIVWLFFGTDVLREVYTDGDLRITYGSDGKHWDRESLYIMQRVK